MIYARCDKLALVLVAAYALGLGACRHAEEAPSYGSLKDDHVVTGSTRPARVASAPLPRAAMVTTPRIAVAVPPPTPIAMAPAVKAPAPMVPPAPKAPMATSASIQPSVPQMTAPSVEQPLPAVEDSAGAARMLSEGQVLFDAGKVLQARRRFISAMNAPNAEVVLALGRTYDTYYLSRLPTSDAAPDMQRALVLYERALERGATTAAADLERTRNLLKIPR